jgi:hypothetical protein
VKTPDAINSFFEAGAVCITWLNVRALYRDKKVYGIWWPQTIFFLAWGTWAFILFDGLGFRLSQVLLSIRLVGYATWMTLFFYYRRRLT